MLRLQHFDFTPSLSPDETTLYFASTSPGAKALADVFAVPVAAAPALARAMGWAVGLIRRRYPPGCSPGASWPVRATYSE